MKRLWFVIKGFWCWAGIIKHRWKFDEDASGRPGWCDRCNWWGGFTIMEVRRRDEGH